MVLTHAHSKAAAEEAHAHDDSMNRLAFTATLRRGSPKQAASF